MTKNILSLTHKEALDYFMSAPNYSTLELPDYLDMNPVLKHVRKTVASKAIEDCMDGDPLSCGVLNYTMNLNKDGKYALRPITLINPYIYYFIVREICSKHNWNYLKEWFKAMQQPSVTVSSLPVVAEENEAFHNATTILNWWSKFEQGSLELSLEYPYMFISDIRNCYGSINVGLIEEALNNSFNPLLKEQSNGINQKFFAADLAKLLHLYQDGLLVGIPQGSVLSDFIAEIILAYSDMLFCKAVQARGLQCNYKILRYRDDYRIFCEDKEALTELSYILQSVLQRMGFEMNSQKTTTTEDLIKNSIKSDKLAYIYKTPILNKKGCDFDGLQKHLLFIYQFGKEYPNSGQLKMLLSDFSQRIEKILHPQKTKSKIQGEDMDGVLSQEELDDLDDIVEQLKQLGTPKENRFETLKKFYVSPIKERIRPMVAIATQIAMDNVGCSHYALRVISQLLSTCDTDQKKEISTLVVNRLLKQPNNGYTQLWLQAMTYLMDKEAKKSPYTNDLCKMVMGQKVSLWNLDWLKDEFRQKFPIARFCNMKRLQESGSEIKFKQRDSYAETAKVIATL